MTKFEERIWKLVHSWCDGQLEDIPDMNLRHLMDNILELVQENNKLIQAYAEFCVRCDRQQLPLVDFDSFVKLHDKGHFVQGLTTRK